MEKDGEGGKTRGTLGVETSSKLYRYNPDTKQIEVPDPNVSRPVAQNKDSEYCHLDSWIDLMR